MGLVLETLTVTPYVCSHYRLQLTLTALSPSLQYTFVGHGLRDDNSRPPRPLCSRD